MDCDFSESEYYYTHPRCQGEMQSDDLRWLASPWMLNPDPQEQLGNATELSPQVVHPIPHPVMSEHQVSSLLEQDAISNADIVDITSETMETGKEQTGEPQGYTLAPRSTRGIPPKRYDPDYEAKRSRYPIEPTVEGNMSQSALAFNVALYATELPKNVDKAMQDDRWRKAMEEEIEALRKNKTREKCILPKEKK